MSVKHSDLHKQAILEKAIRKAIDSGFKTGAPDDTAQDSVIVFYSTDSHWYELIYDHDFAKAVFGEDMVVKEYTKHGLPIHAPRWQLHLSIMVVYPDPIEYLSQQLT